MTQSSAVLVTGSKYNARFVCSTQLSEMFFTSNLVENAKSSYEETSKSNGVHSFGTLAGTDGTLTMSVLSWSLYYVTL